MRERSNPELDRSARPMDEGYGPGYRRRYEEPYYNRYYYGYRRPPTKWEQKGFCPPGQAKKGNC
jgi:hypothetical protein